MGIKGIYKEIGPGKRVSLCKLAVEKLEQSGRPLRLAIDVAIWQFQVQAAKGGANPAIRTLFYRLVRLLSLPIQPIFVFDGPNKPAFKRNKRSGRGDGVAIAMAKRLIRLLGFYVHDAPGEAEAECALLQQQGVVDAVLSEDVDTIMFGCTRTLRNWSAEGPRGSRAPTHVSMYDTADLRQGESGLDREGMVLVALMSGGDYMPEGVAGCGVKVACEAAKGGFGKSLCRLKKADSLAIDSWRESLLHELRTNESGFFRTKHKSLSLPESFPNLDILRYYTHPVVSQTSTIERLREEVPLTRPIDMAQLREFVRETFDWTYRIGAVKFIRVMAPSVLFQQILSLGTSRRPRLADYADESRETGEAAFVSSISNRRTHPSTDGTPELRVSFTPATIIGIDLDKEPEEATVSFGRDGLALNSDDEFEEQLEGSEAPKNGAKKTFDPLQPDVAWIPESVAKMGIPLTVEDWEEKQRAKARLRLTTKGSGRRRVKETAVQGNTLDRYMKTTKPFIRAKPVQQPGRRSPSPSAHDLPALPPIISTIQETLNQRRRPASTEPLSDRAPSASVTRSKRSKQKGEGSAARPSSQTNPWTLAGSQVSPRVTKSGAFAAPETIVISSSPPRPSASPPRSPVSGRKRPEESRSNDGPGEQTSPVASPGPEPRGTQDVRRKKQSSKTGPAKARDGAQLPITRFGTFTDTRKARVDDDLSAETSAAKAPRQPSPHDAQGSELGRSRAAEPATRPEQPLNPLDDSLDPAEDGVPADGTAVSRSPPKRKKKVYLPRASGSGFFEEVETSAAEAQRLTSAPRAGAKGATTRAAARATAWRHSEVSVVDLTGDE